MNGLDWILILVLGIFILRGAFRGLVREGVGLLALGGGLCLAMCCFNLTVPFFLGFTSSEAAAKLAGFAALFILAKIAGLIVLKAFKLPSRVTPPAVVDYGLGGVFGAVEGLLGCLVMVVLLTSFTPGSHFLTSSGLAPLAMRAAAYSGAVMPDRVVQALRAGGIRIPEPPAETTD